MAYIIGIAAVVSVVVWLVLQAVVSWTQDAKEPPVVLTTIPFLSPIFGILRRRYKLFMHLFNQYNFPIYTLRLPFSRLYVINDTSLVSSVERQSQVLSFAPIEADATANLLGMSEEANATLKRDPASETGHFITFHKAFRPALSPGKGLDELCQKAVQGLTTSLSDIRKRGPAVVNLFQWVQHELIMATTDAEFGPGNPFRDAAFEQAWYKFDPAVPLLSANAFPGTLARDGLKAREFLAQGFMSYFRQGHHQGASAGLHARLNHGIRAGFSQEDIARGEVGACLAILNNAVPAAFWTLYHIFSDPVVLSDCRRELADAIRIEGDTHVIDMSYVKSSCPILLSTFNEVLRYRGVGTHIIRRVLEDHMLDNRYLLKKDSIILIPHAVQHFKPDIWGSQANEFQHRRFVHSKTGRPKRYNATAFRPFGAGSTLCPGRHFANTEILSFAALAIASVEMEPTGDKWPHVKTNGSFGLGVARIFLLPENEVEVQIRSNGNQTWRVAVPQTSPHGVREKTEEDNEKTLI